ncbi:hypothetical protein NA56DRAFT_641070 [Hyaloscypha hepaticicola]|uniref:Uncharacterized protein n=1 Tax=Hyaloscypha hepaticicola TaxID=2082293 RepID=A0A2J6QMA5_9HELO|nr:hypothetical protein NA56DRAFT_641070 [Hyaloscypha hepaticicola]
MLSAIFVLKAFHIAGARTSYRPPHLQALSVLSSKLQAIKYCVHTMKRGIKTTSYSLKRSTTASRTQSLDLTNAA